MRQQAANDESRHELWAALLAEAGLRSSVVAHWLKEEESQDWIKKVVDRVPRRERWFGLSRYGPWRRNHYLELLTAGTRSPDLDSDKFALLSLLRSMPPIGQSVFQLGPHGFFIFGLISMLFLILGMEMRDSDTGAMEWAISTGAIPFWAFYPGTPLYQFHERSAGRCYKVIINTAPEWVYRPVTSSTAFTRLGVLRYATNRMVDARNKVAA